MPRYTDVDALYELGHYDDFDEYVVDWKTIDNAPTADAVPVVRCKDCKYWERDVIFQDGWCRGRRQGDPNWFCADGERRENATD